MECSAGWTQVRRGVDIESEAGQRRVSDGSSVSGTRFREPCPVALWFTDPSTEQVLLRCCKAGCIDLGGVEMKYVSMTLSICM